MTRAALFALCLAAAAPARGDPLVLRMAATAPDGTGWAREVRTLTREVETATGGDLRMKWYLGGIAGDEEAALARIRRDQLDGAAGSTFCEQLAPSLRVTRVAGLVRDRAEAANLVFVLRKQLDEEFEKQGFADLVEGGFGAELLFSRAPVRSLADLRRGKYWVRELDAVLRAQLPKMGITVVPLPIEEAGRAFEEGRIDGFIAPSVSALVFQWSTRARYFTTLPLTFLEGCMVVTRRALDKIPFELQKELRGAVAKAGAHFEDLNQHMDQTLVGGLFERQGLKKIVASEAFAREFAVAAASARDQLSDEIIPKQLMRTAIKALDEFRERRR